METQTLFAVQTAPLTELYKPSDIQSFAGLPKVKKILTAFARNPREAGLLFCGAPGTGKSTMARVLASTIGAEVHAIGSAECKIDVLEDLVRMNQYIPMSGGWHCNILEEFDGASDAAQRYLLSKLDGTATCPRTLWIMTANSTDRLEERLISRTLQIQFDGYGSGSETVSLLERIWNERAPANSSRPNFAKLCSKNIRQALQNLELELMCA